MSKLLKSPVTSLGFAPLTVCRWEMGIVEFRYLLLSAAMQTSYRPASGARGRLARA